MLALDLAHAAQRGWTWTGVDGVYTEDQLQYLAWIRAASEHGLISDMFVLRSTPADYLQPLVAISGGLVAAGLAPWLALLVWQPVGLVAVFAGVRALVARVLPGRRERMLALVLALFGGMAGAHPDLWLVFWSWGYPFALIALAAALGALLAHARARERAASPWPAALLGALAAWLHPWQGELLIAVVLGAELLCRRRGQSGSVRATLLVLGATALPLVYYGALRTLDPAWQAAESYGAGGPTVGLLPWVVIPLGLPALAAYRLPAATFEQRSLRVWPPAAVALMLLDAHLGSTATHALLGISVPLGVLAVQGISSLRLSGAMRRWTLVAFALLATVPVTVDRLAWSAGAAAVPGGRAIDPSQARALGFLASRPDRGGVLSDFRLGELVPERTGRHVYLGDQYWSQPDSRQRWQNMFELLGGYWSAAAARDFVQDSGARFLLSDCPRHRAWLRRELAGIVAWKRSFGCVTVYGLRWRV